MSIQAQCDACGKRMGIPDQYAGKLIRCPACKEPLKVPAASSGAPAKPAPAKPGASKTAPSRPAPPKTGTSSPKAETPSPKAPSPKSTGTARATPGTKVVPSSKTTVLPKRPAAATPADATKPGTGGSASDPKRTTARLRAPGASPGGIPTKCPSCGASVPAGKDTCACGYHLKLKRNLSSLRDTITMAALPEGTRLDGSTYKSRREKVKEHQSETRRTLRKTLLVTLICAAVLVLSFVVFLMNVFRVPSLDTLRENEGIRPPTEFLSSFHPYHVGETVNLTLPLHLLTVEEIDFTPEGNNRDAIRAQFASTVELPYIPLERPLLGRRAQAVRHALESGRGTFGADAWTSPLPVSRLVLHRENMQPAMEGYLRGVLLDFEGRQEEAVRALQTETEERDRQMRLLEQRRRQLQEQLRDPYIDHTRIHEALERLTPPPQKRMRIRGTLGFIPVRQTALLEGETNYGRALIGNGTRVPRQILYLDPEQEETPPEAREYWFFCPVLRVSSFLMETVEIPPATGSGEE